MLEIGTPSRANARVAFLVQPSMRGTVDSHNWSSRLVEKPVARSYRVSDYD